MLAKEHDEILEHNPRGRHVLGIDPGSKLTAYVLLQGKDIIAKGKVPNVQLYSVMKSLPRIPAITMIEKISMGGQMRVDNNVLETAWWTGRIFERALAMSGRVEMVHRKTVVTHHTNDPKAGDKEIRRAMINRYGGEAYAIGKKAAPGPLYGVAGDMWSALAIALYAQKVIL